MSRRFLVSIVVVLLVTPSLAGQSRLWTAPHTADGQLDLQGFWTNATFTPLDGRRTSPRSSLQRKRRPNSRSVSPQEDARKLNRHIYDVHYDFTQFDWTQPVRRMHRICARHSFSIRPTGSSLR